MCEIAAKTASGAGPSSEAIAYRGRLVWMLPTAELRPSGNARTSSDRTPGPRPALGRAFAPRVQHPGDARQVPRDQGDAGSGGVADRGEWQRLPEHERARTSSTLTIPLIIRLAAAVRMSSSR